MDTLTLKIPKELKTKLNRLAKEKGVTQSEIVRKALQDLIADDAFRLDGAFLDFAEDLAGSVEGPAQLSTDKKFLEGYGK